MDLLVTMTIGCGLGEPYNLVSPHLPERNELDVIARLGQNLVDSVAKMVRLKSGWEVNFSLSAERRPATCKTSVEKPFLWFGSIEVSVDWLGPQGGKARVGSLKFSVNPRQVRFYMAPSFGGLEQFDLSEAIEKVCQLIGKVGAGRYKTNEEMYPTEETIRRELHKEEMAKMGRCEQWSFPPALVDDQEVTPVSSTPLFDWVEELEKGSLSEINPLFEQGRI